MWKQLSTAAFSPLPLVYPGRTQAINNICVGPCEVSWWKTNISCLLVSKRRSVRLSLYQPIPPLKRDNLKYGKIHVLSLIWCPWSVPLGSLKWAHWSEPIVGFCCLSFSGMGDLGLTSGCSGGYIRNKFPQLWWDCYIFKEEEDFQVFC